jgi:hypothetical protein
MEYWSIGVMEQRVFNLRAQIRLLVRIISSDFSPP